MVRQLVGTHTFTTRWPQGFKNHFTERKEIYVKNTAQETHNRAKYMEGKHHSAGIANGSKPLSTSDGCKGKGRKEGMQNPELPVETKNI